MFDRLRQKALDRLDHSDHKIANPEYPTFISGIYFSNWSVYNRKHFPKDLPSKHLTNVFYAFIGMDPNTGSVKFTDEWADIQLPMNSLDSDKSTEKVTGSLQQLFQLKQQNRHLKVSMSIGGWGTAETFTQIMKDEKKMSQFVSTSIIMLLEYGFDGIDIDWEYPKNTQEGELLVELLQRLRIALNNVSPSLLLTAATPASKESLSNLNMVEMNKYLSFWNVMCYDFAGSSWSQKAAFHSNLFGDNGDNSLNCSDIISTYKSFGVESSKLVLGMPLYGRSFYQANGGVGQSFNKSHPLGSEDTLNYKDLPKELEHFDSRKVSAYAYNPNNQLWVCYDNPQSSRIKAKYVELNKLAGGMWWDSAGESSIPERSLVVNFVDQLGGIKMLDKSYNKLDYETSFYLDPLK